MYEWYCYKLAARRNVSILCVVIRVKKYRLRITLAKDWGRSTDDSQSSFLVDISDDLTFLDYPRKEYSADCYYVLGLLERMVEVRVYSKITLFGQNSWKGGANWRGNTLNHLALLLPSFGRASGDTPCPVLTYSLPFGWTMAHEINVSET